MQRRTFLQAVATALGLATAPKVLTDVGTVADKDEDVLAFRSTSVQMRIGDVSTEVFEIEPSEFGRLSVIVRGLSYEDMRQVLDAEVETVDIVWPMPKQVTTIPAVTRFGGRAIDYETLDDVWPNNIKHARITVLVEREVKGGNQWTGLE